MNAEIKKSWTAALRSGKYRQGQGRLRSELDGQLEHCCLGVLCELHSEQSGTVKFQITPNYPNFGETVYSYLDKVSVLPSAVLEWAEVSGL